ncbi:glycoside hydrolase family 3 C-terminal domain-containing protein [Microbacterium sp. AZCO]|uniref:glycoside hydrolase family 3 C-terminal domain-containing protein n=1 Tax=Microbacterium sp. AZCO TaxID=3142976 RepID=UPI0031F41BF3
MTDDLSLLSIEHKASLLSGRDWGSTKPIEEAGIRSVTMADGPHGIRYQEADSDHLGIGHSSPSTCFPPAVAVGSSWDPELAAAVGTGVAEEAVSFGVDIVLGPGVNIKRSPLCGRNFEYYSEDPLISGVLGAAYVTALQHVGPGASVKHFAANNQETERMRVSADVDDRTLREIYLPAFERVVTEARPATVMCSYNRINGVPASHNRRLLTEVLRGDWGYRGAVISDWGAVSDRVEGVRAGMDLEMPSSNGATDAQIVDAVASGSLDETLVDASVRRVLALTERPRQSGSEIPVDTHHRVAREVAAGSVVLLKNDTALPLTPRTTVAVIGEFATEPRYQGGGSSHLNATRTDIPLEEIRNLAGARNVQVVHARGFSLSPDADAAEAEKLRQDAVATATSADVAVVFAGLSEREESEGYDRTTIQLPESQVQLIREVAATSTKTVVVLSNGGIVSLEGWHDDVDAIVEGFLLGQAGGGAVADILFGVVNPSGHLAETIPLRLQDNPSWLNFPGEQGHVHYGEGIFVGYRYYTTAGVPVRYPFGHGLSYTTFETTGLEVAVTGPDSASAQVTVRNTGPVAGKHVVQLYVATTAGPVRRPLRELRSFAKVELQPGESRTANLDLDRRAFAYWDIERDDWVVASGDYTVQVCADAETVLREQVVPLTGDSIVRELSMESSVGDWIAHPVVGPALMAGMASSMTPEQKQQAEQNPDGLRMVESMPMQQFLAFTNGAIPPEALDQLIGLSRMPAPVV